jgi:hypothetical protein
MAAMIETKRLRLRRFTPADAAFALELVNDPAWLRFIGDRGVLTLVDTHGYIGKIMPMYERYGFGLWVVDRVMSQGMRVPFFGKAKSRERSRWRMYGRCRNRENPSPMVPGGRCLSGWSAVPEVCVREPRDGIEPPEGKRWFTPRCDGPAVTAAGTHPDGWGGHLCFPNVFLLG